MLRIDIITIFPTFFSSFDLSIIKRACEKGLVEITIINLREFSKDKHHKIDEKPFGGGAGMLMMAPPIFEAVESLQTKNSKVILTTPRGEIFNQNSAKSLAQKSEHLIFICGHYEGIDERVMELVDMEFSIGDYILTNGNLATMVISDAVIRLLPGALGSEESLINESFSGGLLEYPQYTKPVNFRNMRVPDILLSGNHKKIDQWRQQKSSAETQKKRPDLIDGIGKRKGKNERSV